MIRVHWLCLLCLAGAAQASPGRRFALVVGANRGDSRDQPLRFAEADAERMTRVLRELGGFAASDLVELKSPTAGELAQALGRLSTRMKSAQQGGRAPFFLFYYSGHSDSDGLHLGETKVSLGEVQRLLRDASATMRLAIVDSCASGALTRVKGMHTAPAIEVRLLDDLSTQGEAVLTSSTSDELARESDALKGSFFTHHLISGLRGAADRSKDGRVTLAEAYDYAYQHTVAQARGGQHPTFKYDLAGRGEVILTSLGDAGAWLSFAEDAPGLYFIVAEDGAIMGEIEVGHAPLKVALAPGQYQIHKHTGQGDLFVDVFLGHGEERWIHAGDLRPLQPMAQAMPKGELWPPPPPPIVAPLPTPVVDYAPPPPRKNRRALWAGLGVASAALAIIGVSLGVGLNSHKPAASGPPEPVFTIQAK